MAAKQLNHKESLINLQVDYPEIHPETLKLLESYIEMYGTIVSALYMAETDNNIDEVKIVTDEVMRALYFSRTNIPYGAEKHKIHIGIYGFPHNVWTKLLYDYGNIRYEYYYKDQYKDQYRGENLEQLYWLYLGHEINMFPTGKVPSINTQTDLDRLRERTSSVS